MSNLEIWDYYTSENLYTGPIYDLELFADLELANVSNEGGVTANPDIDREDFQTCLNGCYGNTQDIPRDEATYLLNELNRLKEELDQKTQHWTATWDDLKIKDVLKRQTRMVRKNNLLCVYINSLLLLLTLLLCTFYSSGTCTGRKIDVWLFINVPRLIW